VARLVLEGDTNREAAAKLFISPATVEYGLPHIYQKLGVSSRTWLARKISQAERNAVLPGPRPGRAASWQAAAMPL
jgi:DNA-binding NarL/FixJ family response regulator